MQVKKIQEQSFVNIEKLKKVLYILHNSNKKQGKNATLFYFQLLAQKQRK